MFRAAATILVALGAASAAQPAAERRLTEVQMRKLAFAGVKAKVPAALKLRGFELDRQPNSGGYAYYMAMADVGEGNEGFYVIDPRTGDLWDGVSECGVITSAEIRRLQRAYRKRLGLSASAYSMVKRRGPICDQEP
jgi:hypothetical protein